MKQSTSTLFCRSAALLLVSAVVYAAGCDVEAPTQVEPAHPSNHDVIGQDPDATFGGEDNTFNHAEDLSESGRKTDAEVMAQRLEEGPAPIRTRMHSCTKLPVETLRNVLEDFGVSIDAGADPGQPRTAGQLYRDGQRALGIAEYNARISTPLIASAAGAAKGQDIWMQAASEIIAAMETLPQCMKNGQPVAMFDASNRCNRDAVTCLIARPATDDHVALCNEAVTRASDVDKGKIIAVASLLAAAHTCE
ncbi:hypothetical protein [Chondromyces apiculatus]|uniref:Lipoprotein n=1 Tax=Chondromyces apiculatus DSM 436 TaxID=1192034 RepID=A0A017TGW6_9BACT|nr:hypothetical protein [Chondromyces apiculatus]EYF08518.1 Hypothetical protein CAP_4048 [Chondromyces apiculatus DSM 436]